MKPCGKKLALPHPYHTLRTSRMSELLPKMTNKLILNYLGDAVIYSSDLQLLDCPTEWLNSDLIHFHFLRLQNEPHLVVGSDTKLGKGKHPNIDCLFLDPTVISFIMHQLDESDEDEVSNLILAWKLPPPNNDSKQQQQQHHYEIKRIFVPINDQHKSSYMSYTPGQYAGGTHWSLLVIDIIITATPKNDEAKPEVQFYSFDSHRGCNISAANAVASKMYSLFQQHYSSLEKDGVTTVNVIDCEALQQNNGYDCGLYTLGFAEALLRLSNEGGSGSSNGLLDKKAIESAFTSYMNDMGGQLNFASNLRRRIGDDIRKLALEYQQSK